MNSSQQDSEKTIKKIGKWLWICIPAVVLLIAIGMIFAVVIGKKQEEAGATDQKVAEEVVSEETGTVADDAPEEEEDAPEEEQEVSEEPSKKFVERKIKIKGTKASSHLETKSQDGQTYEPEHLIDGWYLSAWIEGKDDLGIGESVELSFDKTERITRMVIYNGFLDTKYRYAINGKVTKLLVEFDDGTSKTIDVKTMSAPEEKETFQESEMQPTELILDEPITASSVKLTIMDAVSGSKYDDVAISEIELYHEVEVPALSADMEKKVAKAYTDVINACKADELGREYSRFALANIASNGIPQLIMLKLDAEGDDTEGFFRMYSVDENGNAIELHNRTWEESFTKMAEEYGSKIPYNYDTEWPLGGSGRNGFLYYEYQDLIRYSGYDLDAFLDEYFRLDQDGFYEIGGYDYDKDEAEVLYEDPVFYLFRYDADGNRIEGEHNLTYDDVGNAAQEQFGGEGDPIDISGWYSANCVTYRSKQEMLDYLETFGSGSKNFADASDANSIYKQCLNDMLSGDEWLDMGQDGISIEADASGDSGYYFFLQDITDDGKDELLIGPFGLGSGNKGWAAYCIDGGKHERLGYSDFITVYDPDRKEFYSEGMSPEGVEISVHIRTAQDVKDDRYKSYFKEIDSNDPSKPYFYHDGTDCHNISEQEFNAFMDDYNAIRKKYAFQKGHKLTWENIEKYL